MSVRHHQPQTEQTGWLSFCPPVWIFLNIPLTLQATLEPTQQARTAPESFNASTYNFRKPNIISSRALTVEPSAYYSHYRTSARAQTVTPGHSTGYSGYRGYFGRSNVARSQDNKPHNTWYKPSRSEHQIQCWDNFRFIEQVHHVKYFDFFHKVQKLLQYIQDKIFLKNKNLMLFVKLKHIHRIKYLYFQHHKQNIFSLYFVFCSSRICFPKVLSLVYGHNKTFKTHQSLFPFFILTTRNTVK